MDCRESRDLMSGAVDNQLHSGESHDFNEHIEICGSCRNEYELEKLTKAYIKRKITFVEVPYDLERAIMEQLAAAQSSEHHNGFFSRLISNRIFQPILAVGLVFAMAVILFFANKPNLIMPTSDNETTVNAPTGSEDVFSLAMNNFQDILSGKFKPQVTAVAMSDVASYLNQNAGYSIPLPSVASADWIGGAVSDYRGDKMAQVIYKMGEQYIYICSFPKRILDSKKTLFPSKCAKAVTSNQWFWGQDANGDTQAAWSSGDHICIATSNLEKKELTGILLTTQLVERKIKSKFGGDDGHLTIVIFLIFLLISCCAGVLAKPSLRETPAKQGVIISWILR